MRIGRRKPPNAAFLAYSDTVRGYYQQKSMPETMPFPDAVAILAGGKSRRMGTDKAMLRRESGGETLLERTIRLSIEATGLPVFVIGRAAPDSWPDPSVPFLPDQTPGLGPMGGLQTALNAAPSVLVLSCDLPALSIDTIRWLREEALSALAANPSLDGVAIRNGDQIEPLCAIYRESLLPRIGDSIHAGRRSLLRLIESGNFVIRDIPVTLAPALANANTPEDWAAACAAFAKPGDSDNTEPAASAVRPIWRLRDGQWTDRDDCLVVEEPLEIRVDNRRFTITMRTPGDDLDLARGLLFAEGVIASNADLGDLRHCDADGDDAPNLVIAHLAASAPRDNSGHRWQRTLMSGTSCGLCGKSAIEAVACIGLELPPPSHLESDTFTTETLLSLPDRLREHQPLFTRTGGLHAAGLFTSTGDCLAAAEDIGRHNATDKVIGHGLREGWLPWNPDYGALALLISGRASFEIVQKSLMAQIPVVCSVSAASSLAAELAAANNQTLIGFLRKGGMAVYAGRERVSL